MFIISSGFSKVCILINSGLFMADDKKKSSMSIIINFIFGVLILLINMGFDSSKFVAGGMN